MEIDAVDGVVAGYDSITMEGKFVNQIETSSSGGSKTINFNDFLSTYEPSIDEVDYLGNFIVNEGIEYLHLFDLKFTTITSNRLIESMKRSDLEQLSMIITDEHSLNLLKALKYTRIKLLNLSNSKINVDELIKIAKFVKQSNVEQLELNDCQIDDEKAVILVESLKNKYMDLKLESNLVSDEGATKISELLTDDVNIGSIVFYRKEKEDEKHQELKVFVGENTYYKIRFSLNLSNNLLTYKGKLALIQSVSQHQKLTWGIRGFKMSWENVTDLIDALINPTLNDINDDNASIDSIDIDSMTSDEEDEEDDDENENVNVNSEINLMKDTISLMKTNDVYGLHLDSCGLDNIKLKAIISILKYTKIEDFSIARNDSIHIENIIQLSKVLPETKITKLNLSSLWLDTPCAKEVARGIINTKIAHLDLSNNDGMGTCGLTKIFKRLPSTLKELNFSGALDSFNPLHFPHNVEQITNNNITKLILQRDDLRNEDVELMIDTCLSDFKLHSLDLSDNDNLLNCYDVVRFIVTINDMKICEFSFDSKAISDDIKEILYEVIKYNIFLIKFLDDNIAPNVKRILDRNLINIRNAFDLIDKYMKNKFIYDHSYLEHFKSFLKVGESPLLTNEIANYEEIKRRILMKLNENYFQITGVVKSSFSSTDTDSKKANFSDLSPEILWKISSYLVISDIKSSS